MAGYTRQSASSITNGSDITAPPLNAEFNQVLAALNNTTGHKHDGTAAEGPVIGLIGDPGVATPLNKVVVDNTNNRVGVFVDASGAGSTVEQVRISDGLVVPVTTNDISIGASNLEFKDLYIDGTAHIDTLDVDINAAVAGTFTVTGVTALNGGLTMDSNKFTVANTSGNVATAGTLTVTGATALNGGLAMDTNKFTVANTSGDVATAGTLAVTGTSAFTGAVTADGGVSIDNITIDGTEIDLSSGDLTVDVAGDIYLNADGANIVLQDGSATFGSLNNSGGNLVVKSGTTTAATFAAANVDFAGTVDVTGAFTADSTVAVAGVLSPASHLDMPDDAIIKVGTGDDLEISHDGTNSLISNKTGALKIATETSGIAVTIGHTTSEVTVADNLTITGNLTVGGTQTVVDTVTMNAQNAVVFEGATPDDHETILTIVDPTADRTINLPNQSGTIPVLAAASNDQITATPTELSIVDGNTAAATVTLIDADRVVVNDAGVMKQVAMTAFETYMETSLDTLANVTTVGALNSGSITSGFGAIDNGSSAITTTGTINFGSLADGSITVAGFKDEDDMASNSATHVPTQQSVKAYVSTIAGQSNNVVGLQASAAELNILNDATVTTAELNILDASATTQATVALAATDGVVISDALVMKQCLVSDFDTFMASTSKTLTNKTLTSPILNGTIVVSDGSNDFNIASHDGSNGLKLGGTLVTASAAELNYLDIATLGTSAASKTVTADANGNIKISEEIQAKAYLETVVALSAASSVTLDLSTGNVFTLTTGQNTTFVFNYGNIQLTTADAYAFTLRVLAGGGHSLTWPSSVKWSGGTAPDAPASGEYNTYVFVTVDGGSRYEGAQAVDAGA